MTVGTLGTRRNNGLTILELAVVTVIIGILASFLYPVYAGYLARADEARCLANLRSLYVAASGYLHANGSWPQVSVKLAVDAPETFARDWVAALSPYGAPHTSWICPAIQKGFGLSMSAVDAPGAEYRIDYMPVTFDDDSSSPWRWKKYPWFVEKAGSHERGNLMIYGDGTTTALISP